jgi:argininosuccinate lyase
MSSKNDVFLEEARLGPRSNVLVECEEIPNLTRLIRRFKEYLLTDIAHAVMLTETEIITPERGAKLLSGLMLMWESEGEGFPYLPNVGSFLVQTEHFLSERIDEDTAGRLQTGRSRNDQSAEAERLYLRDLLLMIMEHLILLQYAVLAQAEAHANSLMPGYTHLQHAQPTTFGHHLMRYAAAFDRDLDRLAGAYSHVNLSSLGGAAMAGTSWPIDRVRTAELLGHDGVAVNSSDAGGFARDYIEETVAALSILMANMGRLANDLYVWSSWEFGYVQVADELAGTSSIMPQKKNPHSLERIKSLSGQATGWFAGVLGCQHSVFSTDLDLTFADDGLSGMGDAAIQSLRLACASIETIEINANRMAESAGAFWSTTSHLADELVRRYDLSFRAAHHIIGRFVRDSIAAGKTPADVEADDLLKAGHEMASIKLDMSTTELRDALDANAFLHSRASIGSVNPSETEAHAKSLRIALKVHREWRDDAKAKVDYSLNNLLSCARSIAAHMGA